MSPEEAHALYLRELERYPTLPPDEERDALRAARAGDRERYRALVWSYLRRAHDLAQQHKPAGMPPLEATEEANTILLEIIDDATIEEVEPALRARVARFFGRPA